MQTIVALALMVAFCHASPKYGWEEDEWAEPMKGEAAEPMKGEWAEPMKGEGALMSVYDGVNEEPKEENHVAEPESEFWNPFYDLLSLVFAPAPIQLPKANNEIRMARRSRSTRRKRVPKPHRSNFDNSGEYLDAHNNHLFGSQEYAEDLVNPNSEEDKAARNPMKDHIRDTLLYNKVMPDRDAFDDYDAYITSFNKHLMSPVKKANKKPQSIWGSWFKF